MDDFRLRIFSVLARTGSFTATARELGITAIPSSTEPPAMSA